MRLVVANRHFQPSVLAVVLTLLGVSGGVWLGIWQINRAGEKRDLITSFEQGAQNAVAVGQGGLQDLPRYQTVELSGHYDPQQQVLLDNMPSTRGQPGYHVLTPLQRDNGEWLMVDRGWVAAGATREQLPDVSVSADARTLRGRLDDLPEPGIRLGSAPQSTAQQWPRVLNYPRQQDLVTVLGRQVAARILLLDPAQPDGYERVWRARFRFGPERHLGYAVTWFGLAAAIAITFVVVSLKQQASDE